MTRRTIGCLAVLLGAGCLLGFAGKSDDAKPEKLIKVTLECEKNFGVMPLYSLGADVVNLGGRSKDTKELGSKRIAFDCLPGATVWLISEDSNPNQKGLAAAILRLLPEDDGKIVHLKFKDQVCYKNDVPCTIAFPKTFKAKEIAKQLEVLRRAKKATMRDSLTVSLEIGAASLPILQELKGSGASISYEDISHGKNLSEAVSKELARAIGEVEPRQLMIDSRGFTRIDGGLSKIEALFLDVKPANAIPDLSKLATLRHLTLANEPGSLDLKPLEKLTQLKALTVFAKECKNASAIGSLGNLEFLVMMVQSPGDLSIFKNLPNLRYLAAEFPADTDFSFVEKMPNLQTLCILNVGEKHNLKPLKKLSHLRCLALSRGRERDESKPFAAKNFKNVKEFERARPDVEVVEYRGLCLGSFWLLPLAAAAAAAAWLIRRRRVGSRLVCQP